MRKKRLRMGKLRKKKDNRRIKEREKENSIIEERERENWEEQRDGEREERKETDK